MGLCLPRRRLASSVARRPRVRPSASTRYQPRLTVSGLAEIVLMGFVRTRADRGHKGGDFKDPAGSFQSNSRPAARERHCPESGLSACQNLYSSEIDVWVSVLSVPGSTSVLCLTR